VRVLLVYWEMQYFSPSMPSAALTDTQKVQLVPGVSPEMSVFSSATVLLWEPQPVVCTKYLYSFLYSNGRLQFKRILLEFKVSASNTVILYGPKNTRYRVLLIETEHNSINRSMSDKIYSTHVWSRKLSQVLIECHLLSAWWWWRWNCSQTKDPALLH